MTTAKMLLILPLILIIGFEATLLFNTPYAWKLGGCPSVGLGACFPVTYDWPNFGLDMAFYTLLGYWLIVVGIGVRQRLFLSPSSERLWKREVLRGRFKMALLGGLLMLALPILVLPSGVTGSGVACLVPSPCYTKEQQLTAAWSFTTSLWGYSILLAILVALLGVLEEKWDRLVGASLVGVSGLYIAGLETFFSTGVYARFSLEQVIVAGILLPLGSLLVLAGGFLAISPPPPAVQTVPATLADSKCEKTH
jgi:hypothetical protein